MTGLDRNAQACTISRRVALGGLLAGATGAALPAALLAQTAPTRRMSSFGQDAVALQQAFDWAHQSRGSLVLDTEVTVRGTVFMGHLHLIDGGGRIAIAADSRFATRPDAGSWGREAAILLRSAPGNTAYREGLDTSYLVRIDSGCRMTFVRSDAAKPAFPIRFAGLREGSAIDLDFAGRCLVDAECNGPDWYFFNRCRIGGSYRLEFAKGNPGGGFWLRDRDERRLGSAYASNFLLDSPVFEKIGGSDECLAIFTSPNAPGHLRARGSVTVRDSTSIGFAVFNDSNAAPADFDVALDLVRVRSTVRDTQAVAKIGNGRIRIGQLDATVTGLAADMRRGAVVRCTRRTSNDPPARIDRLRLASEGGGTEGYRGIVAVQGTCEIGASTVSRIRPDPQPQRERLAG